jgi:hypothetical protein
MHRDAKIHTIFEGTSEIQQLVIARAISGLRIECDYQDLTTLWSGGSSVPEVFAQADARIGSYGYTIRQSESSSS